MTKASKILISFHSLKTKAKAQFELKSFGSYNKKGKIDFGFDFTFLVMI